jgi:catechol 2,3-dioxygenase-like lactoylglutathione lyase family enzyme
MYADLEPAAAPAAFPDPEPIIRAQSLTHVTFERRDPQRMVDFLVDFGFVRIDEGDGHSYLRSYGSSAPFSVEIVAGHTDTFVGFGFGAHSTDDVSRLAAAVDASVNVDLRPGCAQYVRLTDPNGFHVDLVAPTDADPIPTRAANIAVNGPGRAERVNCPVRTGSLPAPVIRLGHVVLQVTDLRQTLEWYVRHFGLLLSDVQLVGEGVPVLAFNRFDRGDVPTDHHSLALLGGPDARFLHVSTETIDMDAVGQGQQFLRSRGWQHHWGVGRHVLGSQFFDYWKDPAGDEWEHYADGDLLTAEFPVGYWKLGLGTLWAWGHDLPPGLVPPVPLPGASLFEHDLYDALSTPARPWLR